MTFNNFRWVFLIVVASSIQILTGCFYRKVKLTKSEKELVPYWTKKSFAVFKCKNIRDTVYFLQSDRKYTPHFDHWWTKTVHGDTTVKRDFNHTVLARSNFPHDKYTDENLHLIQLRISFTKRYDNDTLRLEIDNFDQIYGLYEYSSDTLAFSRPTNKPCNKCITEILWTSDRGIVKIKKNDGTVWKILTKDLSLSN
jgi:hypothetical protein